MPTVSEAARVTVKRGAVWRNCGGCGVLAALPPDIGRCGDCVKLAELRALADFFDTGDLSEVSMAGSGFAAAIADIAHHEIGDPGCWDCYGSVPDEIARLRYAMGRMQAAIKQARSDLAAIERRARRKARAAERGRP